MLDILVKSAQGMRFLRDCSIVHMDMKYDNLLMGKDLSVKIADFG